MGWNVDSNQAKEEERSIPFILWLTFVLLFRLQQLLFHRNGWVADSSKFAYGLPGSIQPYPEFDPFGFAEDADVALMKQYREVRCSEAIHRTLHGRTIRGIVSFSIVSSIRFLRCVYRHPLLILTVGSDPRTCCYVSVCWAFGHRTTLRIPSIIYNGQQRYRTGHVRSHLFLFELFACIGSLLRSSHLRFYCIFFSCSCTFLLCRSTQPSRHLDEVRAVAPKFFFALSAVIGLAELGRALTGFETPGNFKKDGDGNNNALKPNYYPGTLLSFYSLNSSFECLYAVDSINSFIKC